MKRIRNHKRWAIAVSVYLALWFLTYVIGCPQARRHILVESGITADMTQVPIGDDFFMWADNVPPPTRYACDAVAYAPFFVTVKFGVLREGWGYGGTYIFLWGGLLGPKVTFYSWIT